MCVCVCVLASRQCFHIYALNEASDRTSRNAIFPLMHNDILISTCMMLMKC